MRKEIAQQICPPILWSLLKIFKRNSRKVKNLFFNQSLDVNQQDLSVYWNSEIARALESWGEGNAWNEIQLLMVNCGGRVLDIACGTGRTIQINSRFSNIELYGCDISDFLLQKAQKKGIPKNRLVVCDATKTEYENNFFEYSYSIGSLEHFTEDGIEKFLAETYRITKKSSFHMIPVSRKNENEGWIKTSQSYHNNSIDWWLFRFESVYSEVQILDSSWQDDISFGKWFICNKV